MIEEQEEADQELLSIRNGDEALQELHARIASRFRRAEVRERALRFLRGLLAPIERKNGWQLAEELEEQGPRGVQRLLGDADWDEEAARDDLRSYGMEHLGEEHSILVIDETGTVRERQKVCWSGATVQWNSRTAGKRANRRLFTPRFNEGICIPGSITLSPRGMDARSGSMPRGRNS